MKQITTGTHITFLATGEKFILTKTETGFDVKQVKLSKKVEPEQYSFQEFLELYDSGQISIDGFDDKEALTVKAIITNYIHEKEISDLNTKYSDLNTQYSLLTTQLSELTAKNEELTAKNKQLEEDIAIAKDEIEKEIESPQPQP